MSRREDSRDTGIPTRAIHEAYLNMQQAHRQYRQVRNQPGAAEQQSHASYQDAVLTFYELVRPHLRRKSAMQRFWDGELPDYPDQPWNSVEHAMQYCRQHGVGIWALQKHVQTLQTSPNAGDTAAVADGSGSLVDWHEQLNLTENQRLVALERGEGMLTWVELRAVAGLKQLDSWDTTETRERTSGGGFMAGETTTSVELEYVSVWKLTTAKRLLAEAADKMNLLSRVDIDHDDGAIVNFDQSRDDVEAEYRDAEYNSSPDI